jgi:hypothetical protein
MLRFTAIAHPAYGRAADYSMALHNRSTLTKENNWK